MVKEYLTISGAELASGVLSAETFRLAELLLHTRGYVLLRNAIPTVLVDEMRSRFAAIYRDCQESWQSGDDWHVSARERATFFVRASRWRIFPRLQPPFHHPQISANPFVLPLLEAMLGADYFCKFVSSDTCTKGAILQSPHRDLTDTDCARGPAAAIVNIPLMECGLHNGPLEVWPCGSHLWRADLFYRHELNPSVQDGRNPVVEAFAEHVPSEKLVLHPGDILIRDPAMWHRGTPNPSDEPRVMMTLLYLRKDVQCDYGSPLYNMDHAMWEQFEPSVRKLFAHGFPAAVPNLPAETPQRRWFQRPLQAIARILQRAGSVSDGRAR